MSKGFDIPSNKHLGNSHDYWKAPQKNSKQIVVQPLQWLPIDRDENGFATEECLEKMDAILKQEGDILLMAQIYGCSHYYAIDHRFCYKMKSKIIREEKAYTHYLPIPKLEL